MTTIKQFLALALCLTLGACAGSDEGKKVSPVEERSGITDLRICTDEVTETSTSALSGFFGVIVRGLEGPVTTCLQLNGSGSNVKAQWRLEYEDDFGIRYYQAVEQDTYFGEVKITGDVVKVHIIFIDDAGLVQLKGSSHIDDVFTDLVIRYHNFPSYEEALEQQVLEAQQKCTDGTWTVAQCMGYNFPSTFWWNQPFIGTPAQQMLDLAKELLSDPNKSTKLGKMKTDLGATLSQ